MNALAERLQAAADALQGYRSADAFLERLAGTCAEQVRTAAVRAGNLYTDPISKRTWHRNGLCENEVGGAYATCQCFEVPLAIADVVLGGAAS